MKVPSSSKRGYGKTANVAPAYPTRYPYIAIAIAISENGNKTPAAVAPPRHCMGTRIDPAKANPNTRT